MLRRPRFLRWFSDGVLSFSDPASFVPMHHLVDQLANILLAPTQKRPPPVIILRGEPQSGKSSLLQYIAESKLAFVNSKGRGMPIHAGLTPMARKLLAMDVRKLSNSKKWKHERRNHCGD